MVPSRQFMVQQAVLNACITYSDEPCQLVRDLCGVPMMLSVMMAGPDWVRPSFCDQVRKEYRILSSQYQRAA